MIIKKSWLVLTQSLAERGKQKDPTRKRKKVLANGRQQKTKSPHGQLAHGKNVTFDE